MILVVSTMSGTINTLGHLRENCEFDGYTLHDRLSYSFPLSFLKI